MTLPRGPKLGVTLYSFTNEFHSRKYSFVDLLAEVERRALGPGVEIIGFQSIPGFPHITDEFAKRFRELMAKHKLVPTCLSINADVMIRRGRPMSTEESVAYHEPQIRAAATLGFPIARYQYAATPEVIRRLAPLAERLNVKLGLEIHAPQRVDSPEVIAYREMYERVASPYLGFIPDFGACARAIPPGFIASARAKGIAETKIEALVEIWNEEGDVGERRAAFLNRLKENQATVEEISMLMLIFSILSKQDPRAWREIMPQVVHVHGKFYEFDANGSEPAVPYEEILPVFRDSGYTGYLSSEWEGHAYSTGGGLEMVEKHHALCRRILGYARI